MDELRRDLAQRLPLLLEDRELARQREALGKRYAAEEELDVAGLRARAEGDGFGLVQVEAGQLVHPEIVPVNDGQPVPLEQLARVALARGVRGEADAPRGAAATSCASLGRASRDRQRRFAAEVRELVAAAARSLADEEVARRRAARARPGARGRSWTRCATTSSPASSTWPTPAPTRWSRSVAGSSATG